MTDLDKFLEVCEVQSGNQAKEDKEDAVPDWADMCRQLSEIEDMVNNLKRQLMREAGKIKGVR